MGNFTKQYSTGDKLDFIRKTQGSEYDATPPPIGRLWDQLNDKMKT